ncbi:TPA: hypothetical protein N0F65_004191 [Lagenidium giganteum]|uniref:CRAL-TRIO domain-containing protein n=1 Tax=Lagenidium giganteum TaxID=4803 RepID=A0AAV2YN22_9STRA|nr:TPA: hypothetical protein N0F65_004191 [Lagenidium giganteum]
MEIGRVLLRDAQYAWHECVACLMKNALALYPCAQRPPRAAAAPLPMATFILDGRNVCEGVVVSSEHLHSVRLRNLKTAQEFVVDVQSAGRKHMWIDLFANALRAAADTPPLRRPIRRSRSSEPMSTSTNADGVARPLTPVVRAVQGATASSHFECEVDNRQMDVIKAKLPQGKLLRVEDVEEIIREVLQREFTDAQEDAINIGRYLVDDGYLAMCICDCGFAAGDVTVYRVCSSNDEDGSAEHWNESSALEDVYLMMFRALADKSTASGSEMVQALLRSAGVYNVPTALAVLRRMADKCMIRRIDDGNDSSSGDASRVGSSGTVISASDDSRFTLLMRSDILKKTNEDAALAAHQVLEQRSRIQERDQEILRLKQLLTKVKGKHAMLWHVLCVFCGLALVDAWTAASPSSVKLSVIMGFVVWLVLGNNGTTTDVSISIRTGSANSVSHTEMARSLTKSKPATQSEARPVMTSDANLAKPEAATSTLTPEQAARTQAFRVALARATSSSVNATRVFSDEYLYSVISVKDRAFPYAVEKMRKCFEWRVRYGVDSISYAEVKAQLVSGSMYWYGYDFKNRPVLWVRPKLKDMKNMKREVEIRAHVYLLELGCRYLMPPGCTTFTLVADAARLGPSDVDIRLMHGLVDVCVGNYPDRIGMIHVGPLNMVVRSLTNMLWPFLPSRLQSKLSFMKNCASELAVHVPAHIIPTHMGGHALHDLRRPDAVDENAFDLDFMLDQQQQRMRQLTSP